MDFSHSLEPYDIEVIFTGIRPGEKLAEELFVEGEEYRRTRHEKIYVALDGQQEGARQEEGELDRQVAELIDLAQAGDQAGVRRLLGQIVPKYAANRQAAP